MNDDALRPHLVGLPTNERQVIRTIVVHPDHPEHTDPRSRTITGVSIETAREIERHNQWTHESTWPFKTYCGHPISQVLKNTQHCAWFLDQWWFQAKWPNLDALIRAHFGTRQITYNEPTEAVVLCAPDKVAEVQAAFDNATPHERRWLGR